MLARMQSVDNLRAVLSEFTDEQLKALLRLSRKRSKAMEQLALIELSRRDFWYYCRLKAPNFYRENRIYLKKLCRTLQDFYAGDDMVLLINLPPRHGKSYTLSLFTEWVFGIDVNAKIMTASYNKTLSTVFSKPSGMTFRRKRPVTISLCTAISFPNPKSNAGTVPCTCGASKGPTRHISPPLQRAPRPASVHHLS